MRIIDKLLSASFDLKPEQRLPSVERELDADAPFDEAYALCLEAIEAIPGCSLQEQNPAAGEITASTRMNWQTFGDTITLKLTRVSDGQTRVYIKSRTKMPQLLDYGRNAGHVRVILSYLHRERETLLRHASKPDAAEGSLLRAAAETQMPAPPRELLRPVEDEKT